MIKQIIKRDGRRRKFDVRKINAAIYKAQLACGQDDIETVYAITDKVVQVLENKFDNKTPNIENVQDIVENNIGEPYNLSAFTNREQTATNAIIKKININTGGKGGSVEISVTMPDPVAAAQVVVAVKDLLQKYVIELKLQKAEINYNFIKQCYDEAKQVFEAKQEAYAKYQDANKSLSTALSRAKGEQIKNEYDVASSLFNQLTTQLVQAEMKVKEDIPILTVVEPVTVPLYKSSPNTPMILVAFIFLGCVFGCALVFCIDWLFSLGLEHKFLKKFFV